MKRDILPQNYYYRRNTKFCRSNSMKSDDRSKKIVEDHIDFRQMGSPINKKSTFLESIKKKFVGRKKSCKVWKYEKLASHVNEPLKDVRINVSELVNFKKFSGKFVKRNKKISSKNTDNDIDTFFEFYSQQPSSTNSIFCGGSPAFYPGLKVTPSHISLCASGKSVLKMIHKDMDSTQHFGRIPRQSSLGMIRNWPKSIHIWSGSHQSLRASLPYDQHSFSATKNIGITADWRRTLEEETERWEHKCIDKDPENQNDSQNVFESYETEEDNQKTLHL